MVGKVQSVTRVGLMNNKQGDMNRPGPYYLLTSPKRMSFHPRPPKKGD